MVLTFTKVGIRMKAANCLAISLILIVFQTFKILSNASSVSLDFSNSFYDLKFEIPKYRQLQLQVGSDALLCVLPVRPNNEMGEAVSLNNDSKWQPVKKWLVDARMRWLHSKPCFGITTLPKRYKLTFCVRKLVKGALDIPQDAPTDETDASNFSASFQADKEEIYANGTITQEYSTLGESEPVITFKVVFECGKYSLVFSPAKEISTNYFVITSSAPAFCNYDYKDMEGDVEKKFGSLHELDGWCSSVIHDEWHYQYCHPYGLVRRSMFDRIDSYELLGMNYSSNLLPRPNFYAYMHNFPSSMVALLTRLKGKLPNVISYENLDFSVNLANNIIQETLDHQNILTLKLGKGNKCKSTDSAHEASVVFFCPFFFQRSEGPYLAAIEISNCKHTVFMAAPHICSNPFFLPPQQLEHKDVRCFPEVRKIPKVFNSYHFMNVAKNQKDIFSTDFECNIPEAPLKMRNAKFIESVPAKLGALEAPVDLLDYFGFGNYLRSRKKRKGQSPLFMIGQVLRHKRSSFPGVVIGWDAECRAPQAWIDAVYIHYEKSAMTLPHYLITLIKDKKHEQEDVPQFLYVPEVGLETFAFTQKKGNLGGFLDFFFEVTSENGRLIPKDGFTFFDNYPDDLDIIYGNAGLTRKEASVESAVESGGFPEPLVPDQIASFDNEKIEVMEAKTKDINLSWWNYWLGLVLSNSTAASPPNSSNHSTATGTPDSLGDNKTSYPDYSVPPDEL